MAAVAGVRGMGDWGTDERPKNFREMILFRNPNGTAPIFALTSKMGKRTVDDSEFSWWTEPNDLVRLRINGALGNGSTVVDVTVDGTDPNAANSDRHWGDPRHLVKGDLLMVEPSADAVAFNHEVLEVDDAGAAAKAAPGTVFTVKRGRAGTTRAAIADNSYLVKIGNAYEDGSRSPTSASRNPIKYKNYTQIFKNTYKLTGRAKATHTRTGDPLMLDKKRKSWDHSRDIEMAILFGRSHETTGEDGEQLTYTGGLREQIGSKTTKLLSAGWTLNDFLDALSPVFDWDSTAGDQRMVFAGNGALNALNKKIQAGIGGIDINFEGKDKMYGISFNGYRVPQGEIYIKTHPLMSRHPLYTNSMFIIDGSMIKWCPMKGRDTKPYENVEENDEDATKGYWMTDGGVMVDQGGLTCGYIGGFGL